MKEDRFLTIILAFIALLVLLSLGIFFAQQDNSAYIAEDTPDGVVHNYIVALLQEDYDRAYGYLAEEKYKPDYAAFAAFCASQHIGTIGYRIQDVKEFSNTAYVNISIDGGATGPFSERYEYTEQAHLIKQEGKWKLLQMPYELWEWSWYQEE